MPHTAGEWKILTLPVGSYDDSFYAIGLDDSHGIATVNRKLFPLEASANAHLVSAAPDLLKACCQLLEIAELAMPDTYFATDTRVKATQAAIAKATEVA